jgi:TolB protein
VFGPSWSPDGTHIGFERFGDSPAASGIFVIKLDGSGLHQIVSGKDTDPKWSHDGTRIAFWNNAGQGGLQVLTIATGDVVTLSKGAPLGLAASGGDPSWSPDDMTIAVGGAAESSSEIWLVRVDGSGVTDTGLWGVSPSWKAA